MPPINSGSSVLKAGRHTQKGLLREVAPHDLQVDVKTIVWEAYLVACILQFEKYDGVNVGTTTVCRGRLYNLSFVREIECTLHVTIK